MIKALLCAFGFLTRLPVPSVVLSDEDVAKSAGFFAWVGGVLALLLYATWLLSESLGPRISSIIVVLLWALLTGALHLDGLADTVDGLSGGRGDRARSLEIMRDSRIGAHGATALVLVIALKWALMEEVLARGDARFLLAPVIARFACTVLLASFAYARANGLGSAFAGRVGWVEIVVGSLAVCLAHAFLVPIDPWLFPAGLLSALLVAFYARSRLGGLTGDVHGAAIEISELSVLLALCIGA